jgi:hypothetical protein
MHDVTIKINGHVVAIMNSTIPEGLYIFPIELGYLNFGTDRGVAENTIEFDTRHLNGGHYVVTATSRVFVRLKDLAIPVYTYSQQDADSIVKDIPCLLFNTTDVAIYTNLIDCPAAVALGQIVQLNATVMNIGDNDASAIIVQFFQGDPRVDGVQIGANQTISIISAGNWGIVTTPLTVSQCGEYIFVRVFADDETITSNNIVFKICAVRTSLDAPSVTVTYPNGTEVVQGVIYLTWAASDPNNDQLYFEVYYGNGIIWALLASSVTDYYFQWDTTYVPDGDYKILVKATDGLFWSNDTSDEFFTVMNMVTTITTVTSPTTTTTTPTTTSTPWYEQEIFGIKLWILIIAGGTLGVILAVVIIVKRRGRAG